MKILKKWLYKIALPAVASAMVAPVVVSCSVEKIKPETQEEKEKRLEHQRAMEIAPNLTKFLKKHEWRDYDNYNKDYIYIKDIKQLKELTANINHLNDFEKSYLGLYEDIQNFFDNSIHRYTPDNLSFEYFENVNDNSDNKKYNSFLILEKNTLTQEQMFYHKIYQVLKKYDNIGLEGGTTYNGKLTEITKILEQELSPIINEKIEKFSKNHKEFQFKNFKLNFKYGKNGEFAKNMKIIIEVSVEVEYQNQKLPKEIVFPLKFDVDIKTTTKNSIHLEEYTKELEKIHKENTNKTMKKVKTLAEMENILKSKDNNFNRDQLKEIKKRYSTTLKIIEDNKDNEEVEM